MKFSIIGPSGYIAKRHLTAIKRFGGSLHSYLDLVEMKFKDEEPKYFSDENDFFNDLSTNKVDYLVICSPNHLHFSQILSAIPLNIKIISEKPLCIKKNQLNKIESMLRNHESNLFSIFQLRLHPVYEEIKRKISLNSEKQNSKIVYFARRDNSYKKSWKAKDELSGGILFNLGIHYFDIFISILGVPQETKIDHINSVSAKGITKFRNLNLEWHFSIDDKDLENGNDVSRIFELGSDIIDFSSVSEDLHFLNYKEIIESNRFSFDEVKQTHDYISGLIK